MEGQWGPRKTRSFPIARRSLASCWYGRRDKCQKAPQENAIQECHPQSGDDQEFLGSNRRLGLVRFGCRHERETGRTKVPLLETIRCLYVDGIGLLDHMFAPAPRSHRRCANRILLITVRIVPHLVLETRLVDIVKLPLPYRPSPLYHQRFRCCVLFVVEQKVLIFAFFVSDVALLSGRGGK
jgi:hypothetical protein